MTESSGSLVHYTLSLLLMVQAHHCLATDNYTQNLTCEDYECKSTYQCVMVDVSCKVPPCGQMPACRLHCNGTLCASGSACHDGQCQPFKEQLLDFCLFFFCSPGLHCSRGACTAGPLCEGVKCGPEEDCFVIKRKVCDSRSCVNVRTPMCEISDNSSGHVRLVHYILGITLLYVFLMTNFCIYLAIRKCRRKRQVEPISQLVVRE